MNSMPTGNCVKLLHITHDLESRLELDWGRAFPGRPFPGRIAAGAEMAKEILRLREAGSRWQPGVVDPIRPADEIRRAHNLLVDLLLDGELRAQVINLPDLPRVLAVCDALCWILLHRHNNRFAGNLASIEARLDSLGIGVSREGELIRDAICP